LTPVLVNLHGVLFEINGDVRRVQEVIGEILLDQITLVSKADDEIVYPVKRIGLHDVPEYRLPADFHHWLRAYRCLFAQPCAETTGKNYSLQLHTPHPQPPPPEQERGFNYKLTRIPQRFRTLNRYWEYLQPATQFQQLTTISVAAAPLS